MVFRSIKTWYNRLIRKFKAVRETIAATLNRNFLKWSPQRTKKKQLEDEEPLKEIELATVFDPAGLHAILLSEIVEYKNNTKQQGFWSVYQEFDPVSFDPIKTSILYDDKDQQEREEVFLFIRHLEEQEWYDFTAIDQVLADMAVVKF